MSSSKTNGNSDTAAYASGQQPGLYPREEALPLRISDYVSLRSGHPPPGVLTPTQLAEETSEKHAAGAPAPKLFTSARLPRSGLVLKNATVCSPMCMYSARQGAVTPFHLAHLGSFALHGIGAICIEAAAVEARGRITPQDVGIWADAHVPGLQGLASALKSFTDGLTVGIQLAHAGRKASCWSPYASEHLKRGSKVFVTRAAEGEDGWEDDVVAPSAIAWDEDGGKWIKPKELSLSEIEGIKQAFLDGAKRAFDAGLDFVELHAAHGYLLHSFLSPLSNKRTDAYGGSFENRTRLLLEISRAIHAAYPDRSLWVRVSSSDQVDHLVASEGIEAWTSADTVRLAPLLAEAGVEVLDCSSGGNVPYQKIQVGAAYQLPFAEAVRKELSSGPGKGSPKLLTGSVGMLEGQDFAGQVAERALQEGKADLIFLARGLMARPSWPEDAAYQISGLKLSGTPAYHRTHHPKRTATL